jgi:lipopolysaccharide transport system ATP-binding protein
MSYARIVVDNLSKCYRISASIARPETFREAVSATLRSPFGYLQEIMRPPTEAELLWSLKEVSFEVKWGEVVGLIGRNGAGKSTLLKILSRITDPTAGRAVIHGRVGSLLEVGTGFHPDLTGRENVYLNGAILGMKRNEIEAKFDDIVEFADVSKFIDTPVKRYSSGMHVRLAFAVAAHLEPEILIVDEVLAVGDAGFQRKSLGRMDNLANSGRTVLFVSHSMAAIQALCDRVILLESGRVSAIGTPEEVISRYLRSIEIETGGGWMDLTQHPQRVADAERVLFRSLRLTNPDGQTMTGFPLGGSIVFELELDLDDLVLKDPLINIVVSKFGSPICYLPTIYMIRDPFQLTGRVRARCEWRTGMLAPGIYSVSQLAIKKHKGGKRLDQIENVMSFEILSRDVYGTGGMTHEGSLLIPDGRWEFEGIGSSC